MEQSRLRSAPDMYSPDGMRARTIEMRELVVATIPKVLTACADVLNSTEYIKSRGGFSLPEVVEDAREIGAVAPQTYRLCSRGKLAALLYKEKRVKLSFGYDNILGDFRVEDKNESIEEAVAVIVAHEVSHLIHIYFTCFTLDKLNRIRREYPTSFDQIEKECESFADYLSGVLYFGMTEFNAIPKPSHPVYLQEYTRIGDRDGRPSRSRSFRRGYEEASTKGINDALEGAIIRLSRI